MKPNEPTENAQIRWDTEQQPVSDRFGDVYFSRDNGLAESRYVFLQHNQLPARWHTMSATQMFAIGETGFGTGLNFLATWQAWQACNNQTGNAPRLHFISAEKYPLCRADLRQALSLWPELHTLAQALLDTYPPQPSTGMHRLLFEGGNICLTLMFGDAAEVYQQLVPCATNGDCAPGFQLGAQRLIIGAWFLDGFAPAKNPDMWRPELFNAMAHLSDDATTFATFTAAGDVKRGLQTAGFMVSKTPGYGRKRDMLKGLFPATETPPPAELQHAPKRGEAPRLLWHLTAPRKPATGRHVAIIGGGLAGAMAAAALSRRQWSVALFEKNSELANEASGNRQGVVYTRLSPHADPLSEFNLQAQIFANHFYGSAWSHHPETLFQRCGDNCGVLHLATSAKQTAHYQALANRFRQQDPFCQWLSKDIASNLAGVPVNYPGLMIPGAGWLSPSRLCRTLTQDNNIDCRLATEVKSLEFDEDRWTLLGADGNHLLQADAVVIANAFAAVQLAQTAALPLKQVRGQVTHLDLSDSGLTHLSCVLCGDGYVSPADRNTVCTGATFDLKSSETTLSDECQKKNLANLETMIGWKPPPCPLPLAGRVGFRTTTPDYFPLVGPVPDRPAMLADFAPLRHKANAVLSSPGTMHPGLYCLLGLGSRGLAYSPLAAEILAAVMSGEPLPVNQSLYRHLHPARFLVRELIRAV